MDHKEFGRIIRSVRKQRRWTLKRLEDETRRLSSGYLSARIIRGIEQGSKANLSTEILLALAECLGLTTMERKELFYAAVSSDRESDILDSSSSKLADLGYLYSLVRDLLQSQFPAYMVDQYGDVIAANAEAVVMYGFNEEDWLPQIFSNQLIFSEAVTLPQDSLYAHQPVLNLMWLIFGAPNYYKSIGEDWQGAAMNNLLFFRRISLRYRHKDYFDDLLSALLKLRFPINKLCEFEHFWYASLEYNVTDEIDSHYRIYHLDADTIFLALDTPILTPYGELYLVNYLPISSLSLKLFARLKQDSSRLLKNLHHNFPYAFQRFSPSVLQLAPWPKKVAYWK